MYVKGVTLYWEYVFYIKVIDLEVRQYDIRGCLDIHFAVVVQLMEGGIH